MKKTLLNIAVTMSFTGIIFSGSVLSTQAFAEDMALLNTNSNDDATETYLYPGMGVGAASGALVAGPIGLLVGGLIGAIAGSNQDVSKQPELITAVIENDMVAEVAEKNIPPHGIQLAQLGTINTITESNIESTQDTLIDILTSDLSMDIYFRSGSTAIEAFYPARLSAIAELMNNMQTLEIHLDGYTDRRGDKTKNIALANDRIAKVRDQLIDAGVDEHRIISKAFGEMKMVSAAGDLEAYTFDRKVVIRFERNTADSISSMNTALSEFKQNKSDAVLADTGIEF